MSSEEKTESYDERKYFFMRFKNDVQVVFDDITRSKDGARFRVNIFKGSIQLKGDYFIPLRSFSAFRLNCDELLKKLKSISCVLDTEVDSNYNLTLRLKRTLVFGAVLEEVISDPQRYGMFRRNKSVLVVNHHQQKSKSLENLRNSFLSEHVVSILANNGVKVFYNDSKDTKWKIENSIALTCSDKCDQKKVCKDLEEKLSFCNYKTVSNDNRMCIDAKGFIKDNSLSSVYGKALTCVTLSDENLSEDLSKTCYLKHLISDHMQYTPDVVIHIASQGQNRCTFKAGILLSMLGGCNPHQVYVFSQGVQLKGKYATSLVKDGCNTSNYTTQYETRTIQDSVTSEKNCDTEHGADNMVAGKCDASHDKDKYTTSNSSKQYNTDCTIQDSIPGGTVPQERYYSSDQSTENLVVDTAEEFIQSHRHAIEKATSMKHETYSAGSAAWIHRILCLVDTSVKFDVLSHNPSSVLRLSLQEERKSSGVFAQYNHARLCNLFRNSGSADIPLQEVDFEALQLEEEWGLLDSLLTFPGLVEDLVDSMLNGEGGGLGRLCRMLQGLSRGLSAYYGRVRVLAGSRPHQQKKMHARLCLLRGVHQVMRNAFRMLNIEGLDIM